MNHLDLCTFKELSHGTIFVTYNIGGYLIYKTEDFNFLLVC